MRRSAVGTYLTRMSSLPNHHPPKLHDVGVALMSETLFYLLVGTTMYTGLGCTIAFAEYGSSMMAESATATETYDGALDLHDTIPSAFLDAACVEERGSYDSVAPFMDELLAGLRVDR